MTSRDHSLHQTPTRQQYTTG